MRSGQKRVGDGQRRGNSRQERIEVRREETSRDKKSERKRKLGRK